MSASHGLSLEETLNLSLRALELLLPPEKLGSAENVYASAGSSDLSLTFNASGSVSSTDSGSGFKSSDTILTR